MVRVIKSIFIVSILLIFNACSPKVAEVVDTQPNTPSTPPVIQAEPESDTNCATFSSLSGASREEAENSFVIYKDFLKLNQFDEALPIWKKAMDLAPAANGRVKYQFDDGIKIYKHYFQSSDDESKKRAYVDSIMMLYDKRVECFGEGPYTAGRKAFDYYYNYRDYTTDENIISLFKEAIDGKGEKADYFILNPFSSLLFNAVLDQKMSYDEGSKYAKKIFEAVEYGTANCDKDCEAWGIVSEYSPSLLENLEGLEDFFDCTYYKDKYYPLLAFHPESCDTINLINRRLLWGKCDVADPALIAVKAAKDKNCYTPPPPEGPLRRAFNAYSEGKYNDALTLFEEFVALTEDVEKKAKYTLIQAKIYYGDIKNFPKARQKAKQAAQLKPNWGEPFILIGKLYASSGPLCGPGRGWDSQIVTWPAIDMFSYAKQVDPSVSAEANKWIRTYRQYMPSVEDIFQRPNINENDRFFVGCWIQEWTTVRATKS